MSSQVGSGHIAIFPVMTGFKSRVNKEVKAASAEGSKRFGRGFRGAGKSAGSELGKDMSGAFKVSSGDLGTESLGKLNMEVSKSSQALSKARMKQQDEAGKVRVAEAKLAEAVEKHGEGSSQAIAAEERLASARRKHEAANDQVKAASERLTTAQENLKTAQEQLAKANDQAASSAAGLKGKLSQLGRSAKTAGRQFSQGFKGASVPLNSLPAAAGNAARSVVTAFSPLTAKLSPIFSKIGSVATAVAGKIGPPFLSAGRAIGGAFSRIATPVGAAMSTMVATVQSYASTAGTAFVSLGTKMAAPFIRFGSSIVAHLAPVGAAFGKLGSMIAPGVGRMASTFTNGVSGMVRAAGSVGSQITSTLASWLQGPATAVVAAGAAGLAYTLSSGFGRMITTENAQAKLRGLGNSAKDVDNIMKDVSKSVEGTTFTTAETATVAAGAVAAGIKPGKDLQTTLSSVMNVSKATGTSMDEMGLIFNKVASNGKAMTMEMNQVADKGLPIWQAMADQLGVTQDEVRDMASQGKIDFETFQNAATDAAGTVSEEMAKTTEGTIANFKATFGQIGEGLLGGSDSSGIFQSLAPLFNSMTEAMQPLRENAAQLGDAFGAKLTPIMERLGAWIEKLGDGSSGLGTKLASLKGYVAPLGAALLALGGGGLGSIMSKLPVVGGMFGGLGRTMGLLTSPVGLIVAAFAGLVASSPPLQEALSTLASIVGSALGTAFQALQPVFDQLIPVIGEIAELLGGALAEVITALAPVLAQLVGIFAQLVAQVLPPLIPVVLEVAGVIAQLVPAIMPVVTTILNTLIPVVKSLLPVVKNIFNTVSSVVKSVMGAVRGIIKTVMSVIKGDWSGAWNGLKSIAVNLWNGIKRFFSGAVGTFGAIFSSIGEAIKAPFRAAFNAVSRFWNNTVGQMSWTTPSWLPGIGGKTFAAPKMPYLADGGVVTRATMAMVGEGAEPEAVLPLSRLKSMMREVKQDTTPANRPGVGATQNFVVYADDPESAARVIAQRTRKLVGVM